MIRFFLVVFLIAMPFSANAKTVREKAADYGKSMEVCKELSYYDNTSNLWRATSEGKKICQQEGIEEQDCDIFAHTARTYCSMFNTPKDWTEVW